VLHEKPVKELVTDEEGSALVEYTVLIGILMTGAAVVINLVGGWIGTHWTSLYGVLP
jgi:Flp pilus assembly pilin Flp